MHFLARTRTIGAIVVVLTVMSSCQKAFDYSAAAPVTKLSPNEVYDVKIDPSQPPLAAAERYMRTGSYVHSLAYYQAVLQQMPQSQEAMLGIAASYSFLGQFKQADQYFQAVKSTFGETAVYHNDLGFSYILRGDLPRAKTHLQKALRAMPNSETIQNNLVAVERLARARKAGAA